MSHTEFRKRPDFMRSPPSTHLDTRSAHVRIFNTRSFSSVVKPLSNISSAVPFKPLDTVTTAAEAQSASKNQQLLLLQQKKQQLTTAGKSKSTVEHSDNMQVLLNKELTRIHAEYTSIKLYQDPLVLSLQRVAAALKDKEQLHLYRQQTMACYGTSPAVTVPLSSSVPSSTASSWSSSISSSGKRSPHQTSRQQRRASSHTVYEYLVTKKDAKQYSLSHFFLDKSPPPTLLSRFFGMNSASDTQPCRTPPEVVEDCYKNNPIPS